MATEAQYNVCVQDPQGRWTPIPGEYQSEAEAMLIAYASQFGMRIFLGKFTPPVMIQRWERQNLTEPWRLVAWNSLTTGRWATTIPQT